MKNVLQMAMSLYRTPTQLWHLDGAFRRVPDHPYAVPLCVVILDGTMKVHPSLECSCFSYAH